MKKFFALLLALTMVLSMAACTPSEEGQLEGDLNNDGQIEWARTRTLKSTSPTST